MARREPVWIRLGNDDGCDQCRRSIAAGENVLIYSGSTVFFCSRDCYDAHWAREYALRAAIAKYATA